ncbi:MAG: C39 family peptidase [Thermaerobacter sp.]|nr:C39 family peptidase [Thermaerobacter sp.]
MAPSRQTPSRRWRFPKRLAALAVATVSLYYGGQAVMGAVRLSSVPPSGAVTPSSSTPPSSSAVRSSSAPSASSSAVSASSASAQPAAQALPASYLIQVPAKDQYPQLPNGCEVTSLAMLMTAVGHPVSKMTLAQQMPVDPTKLVLTSTTADGETVHHVQYWGNPNVGFVGSVYQAGEGYGIYHGPMTAFLNRLLPGRAEDLTGKPFSDILQHVASGIPVEVWTTTTFQPTSDWVTWQSPEGLVTATPLEHAVLLVGYSPGYLYVNNPLNGVAAQKVPEAPFIQAWQQLGGQAITVRPDS